MPATARLKALGAAANPTSASPQRAVVILELVCRHEKADML